MKKVFLEDLPRKYGIGANKNKMVIDWNNCVGHSVRFVYDDISGNVKILKYNNEILTILYNGSVFENIYLAQFKKCAIGKIVGKINSNHMYVIGDIINDLEILDLIKINRNTKNCSEKGYTLKCIKCGCVHDKLESDLKSGKGCPVCSHGAKIVVKGINDIATTRPDLAKYFYNKDDMYAHTCCSSKRIDMICPVCGTVKKYSISNLNTYGVMKCGCGDGISYPNKLMFSILSQLNIEFETEYSPEWIKPKRYDFYIPSLKLIIEMDGGLGHGYGSYDGRGVTKNNLKQLDEEKDILAAKNGVEVVRIDCAYLNNDRLSYIRNNILNNNLLCNYMCVCDINWGIADAFALSNLVKSVCDAWGSGEFNTTTDISKHFNLSTSTVRKYLKKGTSFKWCEYNGKRESLKINSVNGKRMFRTIEVYKYGEFVTRCDGIKRMEKESIDSLGIHISKSSIQRCLNGSINDYNGYTFKYVD